MARFRSRLTVKTLWQYSHSLAILFAVLLFTAGFLCVLLWTNNLVTTATSASDPSVSTFTQFSPAVSTFSLTYEVAIFGAAWNAIMYVTMLILERDVSILQTERIRYEVEKAACIVTFVGNAIYSVACLGLMAVLARLAADATAPPNPALDPEVIKAIEDSEFARRAGQGTTAAMAGFAALTAWFTCVMIIFHAQDSQHRKYVRQDAIEGEEEGVKQA